MKTSSFTHILSTSLLSLSLVAVLASCGKKETVEPSSTYTVGDESGRKAIKHFQPYQQTKAVQPQDIKDQNLRLVQDTPTDVLATNKVKNDRANFSSEQSHTNDVGMNEGISTDKFSPKDDNDFQIKNPEIRRVVSIDKSDNPSEDVLRKNTAKKILVKSPR